MIQIMTWNVKPSLDSSLSDLFNSFENSSLALSSFILAFANFPEIKYDSKKNVDLNLV